MTEEFKMVPEDQLTKSQREFIGTQFPTPKGGVLTVTGVVGKRGTAAIFGVECSICSQDSELWPEGSFRCVKGSLVRGSIPCGCAKNPRWTEHQTKIRVQRECVKRGYVFKGWVGGEYKGVDNTKLKLFNPITGNYWKSARVDSLLRGSGDPEEGKIKVKDLHTLPDLQHIQSFMKTGSFLEGTTFTRNTDRISSQGSYSYWDVTCPVCSNDEYVEAGLCSGVFTAYVSDLKKGKKSCRCSSPYYWTQEQREYQINKILKEEGAVFNSWSTRKGCKNYIERFLWECSEGHICKTIVSHFLKGTRCPTCAQYGFNPYKPAWFYVVQWQGFGESYIKYGITNHENYMTRIKQQASKSKLDYKIIATYRSESGQLCLDAENKLKYDILKDRSGACPKDWLPAGYSETVEDTPEHLEIILRVADEIIK